MKKKNDAAVLVAVSVLSFWLLMEISEIKVISPTEAGAGLIDSIPKKTRARKLRENRSLTIKRRET